MRFAPRGCFPRAIPGPDKEPGWRDVGRQLVANCAALDRLSDGDMARMLASFRADESARMGLSVARLSRMGETVVAILRGHA